MQPHPQAIPLGSKPLRVELGEGEAPGEKRVPGSDQGLSLALGVRKCSCQHSLNIS